jgi:serine/threonine-protein kinase
LPGGDPLAAALAAGETPSPALVAASGPKEGLRPGLAAAILSCVILGSILSAALGERMAARNGVQAGKRPEILAERAREFLRKTGYAEEFADSASGYRPDIDLTQYIARPGNADRYAALKSRINLFWFRGSSQPLETAGIISGVQIDNPAMQSAGEALVRLDTQGRLVSLRVIPPEKESSPGPAPKADWSPLFYEAGLEYSKWLPAVPERNPLFYADERAAWQGSLPEAPDIPVRIEAAAYWGKPVAFDIIGPWRNCHRVTTCQLIYRIDHRAPSDARWSCDLPDAA